MEEFIKDKLFKMLIILTICFLIYIILNIFLVLRIVSHSNYEYSQDEVLQVKCALKQEFKINQSILSNDEYKKILESKIPIKPYIYIETNNGLDGRTFTIFRIIKLKKGINGLEYCTILAHEMIHLKYLIKDEKFVEFQTFKLLYESDNKYLHQAGCYMGLGILNNYYSEEYNCKADIIEYFLKK